MDQSRGAAAEIFAAWPKRWLAIPAREGGRSFVRSAPVLLAAYAAAALAPLALASLAAPRGQEFGRELGLGAGLVALALLLLQFVLSGRFEAMSGRIGIDLTMRWHQLAARSLAGLVILHPLLLAASPLPPDFGRMLGRLGRLFTSSHFGSGIAAWLIVLVLVTLGMLRARLPVRYEIWRQTHALGAVVAGVLAAHHAFATGFYSGLPALETYWQALLTLGLGSLALIYVVRPLLLRTAPYRVRANASLADGIQEIVLEPAGGRRFRFTAGQFAWVSFGRFPWPGLDHPFSIASCPAELPRVRLLIKESGDFTRRVADLPLGAPAWLDGPHGAFTLANRQAESLCLIAGGIGIAPVISILRDLHARRERRPIALIFAARSEDQLVHRDEIDRMAKDLDLRVTYVVEHRAERSPGRVGILDLPTLRAAIRCKRPKRCLVLICGPTAMMLAVERNLAVIGIPPRRIIYERFRYD